MNNLHRYSKLHLLDNNSKSMFIKDPIYGSISFSDDQLGLYELVNTFEFQRLYKIRQLAFTFGNFPSASHTRYSHCLGAYELCRRFISHFLEKNYLSREKFQHQINIALAAALLHDIGHGPLSHSFESAIPGFTHEEMGMRIISSPETKINKILVNKAIEDGLDPNFYASEIVKAIDRSSEFKWIVDLISSDVDVDRFDFLLRDSYYSGVSYGKTVDISLFIKGSIIHEGRFRFLTKAKNHLEHFFLARHHMYTDLYCNKVSIFYEGTFREAFTYIRSNLSRFSDQPSFRKFDFVWRDYSSGSLLDYFRLYDDNFLDYILEILDVDDEVAQRYRYYIFGLNGQSDVECVKNRFKSSFLEDDRRKAIALQLFDPDTQTLRTVNI